MTTIGGFQSGRIRSTDNLPDLTYQKVWVGNVDNQPVEADGATSAAPIGATYIVAIPNDSLTNEQALSDLGASGLLKSTYGVDPLSATVSIALHPTDYLANNDTATFNDLTTTGSLTTTDITFTSLTQQGATIVPFYTNNIGSLSTSDLISLAVQAVSLSATNITALAFLSAAGEAVINILNCRTLNNTSPIGSTPVATLSGGVNITGTTTMTGDASISGNATINGTLEFPVGAGPGSLQLNNTTVLMAANNAIGSQFTIDCEKVQLTASGNTPSTVLNLLSNGNTTLSGKDFGGVGITIQSGLNNSSAVDGTLKIFCNTLLQTSDGIGQSTAQFSFDEITIKADAADAANNHIDLIAKNVNVTSVSGTSGTAAIAGDAITLAGKNSVNIAVDEDAIIVNLASNGQAEITAQTSITLDADTNIIISSNNVNLIGAVVIGNTELEGGLGDPPSSSLTVNGEATFESTVTFEGELNLDDGLTITTGGLTVSSGDITNIGSLTTTSFTTTTATIPTYVSKVELPAEVAPIITAAIAAGVPPLITSALASYTTSVVAPAIAASSAALTILINGKQASSGALTDISGISIADNEIIVGSGGHWVGQSGDTALASLGLGSGSNVIFNTVEANAVMALSLGGQDASIGFTLAPDAHPTAGNTTYLTMVSGTTRLNSTLVDTALFNVNVPTITLTNPFPISANAVFTVQHRSIFSSSLSIGTILTVTGSATTASLITGGISVSDDSTFSGVTGNRTSVTFNSFTDVTFNGTVTFPGSGSYQPLNAGLTQISAITTPAQNTIIYANGSNQWVGATGNAARGVLDLATTNAPTFLALTLTNNMGSATISTSGLATLNSATVTTTLGVTGAVTFSNSLGVAGTITCSELIVSDIEAGIANIEALTVEDTFEVIGESLFSGDVVFQDSVTLDAGLLSIDNAASEPSTPTSGGILYVYGGALKYIGSSGTVTTLAIA